MKRVFTAISLILGLWEFAHAGEVWKSFELRYYSPTQAANGETDFRGETEVFDTQQRIDYLRTYERVAGRFFQNPDWDQLVVRDEEAKGVLATIKPQPLPEVRDRVRLRTWRWLGFKPGIIEEETVAIEQWEAFPEARVEDGRLFLGNTTLEHTFDRQTWRFMLRWTVSVGDFRNQTFCVGKAFETGFLSDGSVFYEGREGRTVIGPYQPDTDYTFEADIDLQNGGFNLRINESQIADFVPTGSNRPVDKLEIISEGALILKSLYGEGYTKTVFTEDTNSRDVPYTVTILANEDFIVRPDIKGWTRLGYDDSGWETCELPHPHGGQRFQGESLYLRKRVQTGDFTV
ncbi:MAG TPA: hypothetical protein VJ960_03675, partial [Oceanipulchritudo sp.]|nr:hypothetical protein [Oceanipulchritudo sp.]